MRGNFQTAAVLTNMIGAIIMPLLWHIEAREKDRNSRAFMRSFPDRMFGNEHRKKGTARHGAAAARSPDLLLQLREQGIDGGEAGPFLF